jgi:hypothetical protein
LLPSSKRADGEDAFEAGGARRAEGAKGKSESALDLDKKGLDGGSAGEGEGCERKRERKRA